MNLGDPDLDAYPDRRTHTDDERRNIARLERWRDLFNGDDMERFVREAYASRFRVVNFDGAAWTGNSTHRENIIAEPDLFVRAERFIKAFAPGRRIRFNRVTPAGNVITLEASLLDDDRPGWELSWCGVYTFDADGRIVSDHTYLNRNDWPGIQELLGRR